MYEPGRERIKVERNGPNESHGHGGIYSNEVSDRRRASIGGGMSLPPNNSHHHRILNDDSEPDDYSHPPQRDYNGPPTPKSSSRPQLAGMMDQGRQSIKTQQSLDGIHQAATNQSGGPPTPGADSKRDVKPGRVLNRVPRACNACRKQKMRCEGADNPPCRRCRHAGLECLFEKPSREASLTGEAGLERIRALENSVDDVKTGQLSIQKVLSELVAILRNDGKIPAGYQSSTSPQYLAGGSAMSPATMSAATPTSTGPMDGMLGHPHPPLSVSTDSGNSTLPPIISPGSSTATYNRSGNAGYTQTGFGPNGTYQSQHSHQHSQSYPGSSGKNTLPPISSLQYPNSSSRGPGSRGRKRNNHPDSNVTSANSSSDEDENDLGTSGLVAPLLILRGLADAAVAQRNENSEMSTSEPTSRTRSPAGDGPNRPRKRARTGPRQAVILDVVSKGIISENQARELFRIFYEGCSTFLPVFDSRIDTYDNLHPNSPFAVDAICAVGARVMKGGGPSSELFKKCLQAIQEAAASTLFHSISRMEQVQALVLVSGWADNGGWLSGGHAVRMALELSMHRAWPKLKKRIRQGKATTGDDDMQLLIATRTWFTLYMMEHQMSYGTGRPAILKDDETISGCDQLLDHPLSIHDDMRLISTVELMAARERWQNEMGPLDQPITERTFDVASRAREEFRGWYDRWDVRFAQNYPDRGGSFYRQSLEIQYLVAELFHNATALRNIHSEEDVEDIPDRQWDVIRRSFEVAQKFLQICLGGASYRDNLQNAVHYTHATAAFAASFLLRLARLFPNECNPDRIKNDVAQLADLLHTIASAHRFAVSLRLQIHRAVARRNSVSNQPQLAMPVNLQNQAIAPNRSNQITPTASGMVTYQPMQASSTTPTLPGMPGQFGPQTHLQQLQQGQQLAQQQQQQQQAAQMQIAVTTQNPLYMPFQMDPSVNLDQLMQSFQTTGQAGAMWLNDQALGLSGEQNLQFGMDSYMIPLQYDAQTATQNYMNNMNWTSQS